MTPLRVELLERLAAKDHAVDDIAEIGRVDATPSKIINTLHDLRKHHGGLVTFVETVSGSKSPSGHHQSIKRIEITAKGRYALEVARASSGATAANVLSNDARATSEIPLARPIKDPLKTFMEGQRATDMVPFGGTRRVETTPLPGEPTRNAFQPRATRRVVTSTGNPKPIDNLNGVPSVAPGGPVEIVKPVTDVEIATPVIEAMYPELERIRAKSAASIEAQAKAEKYLAAAELLESIDTLRSEALTEMAAATANEHALTRVETEYLAYADTHR
jgi:hypothetical protein